MSKTQKEFAFEELQKVIGRAGLPKPTKRLTRSGKKTKPTEPKEKQRAAPKVMQPKSVTNDRLAPPPTQFLSDREVARRYSVSRATVWRWVSKLEGFPRPVKIAKGTTRWRINDLEHFERVLDTTPSDRPSRNGEAK